MINPEFLLEHLEEYKENLRKRQAKVEHFQLEKIVILLKQKKALTQRIQALQEERNRIAKTQEGKERGKEVKEEIQKHEAEVKEVQTQLYDLLLRLPNMASNDVPEGVSERANVVLREVGKKPEIKEPKDYITLAGPLIDTKRATKVAGTRFGYVFGDVALLEFALIQLAFDTLLPKGFTLVVPPVMIKPKVFEGIGRLTPEQKSERYHLDQDDLYLVGSAEHTIGPLHMDEILEEKNLPLRYLGFSSCFRREAGSYGKDTKGILRVHQFDKVEMFSFATPEKSEEEHQFLLSCQEELMQKLELPYRVMQICSGDLGFTDYKSYDIETWLPGQGTYRETHSCSNTTDFQSRRLNIKVRRKDGTLEFLHMLNGTAFAIGRTLIAILENYQQEDGSVRVPDVLQPYMGGIKDIRR